MAAENGRTDPPLARLLFDEPYRFGFFQAVRLLERMYPERQPVGRDSDPARELVRFRTRVSLNFPASEIHDLARNDSPDEPRPLEWKFRLWDDRASRGASAPLYWLFSLNAPFIGIQHSENSWISSATA
jgi:predicted component of type VI protein secretion system